MSFEQRLVEHIYRDLLQEGFGEIEARNTAYRIVETRGETEQVASPTDCKSAV